MFTATRKEKIVKRISIFVFVISALTLPVFGIGIIFALTGSNPEHVLLIALGYLGIIIFSGLTFFKHKYYPVILISLVIMVAGIILDNMFWTKHNDDLCTQLKNNPTCVETACGFNCTSFFDDGMGFNTPGSVCKDKDMSLCIE